jgi:tetratricopeptide (TPR) repeat protein
VSFVVLFYAGASGDSPILDARRLSESGRFEEARDLLLRIKAEAEKAGVDDTPMATILNDLGTVYTALGEYTAAEKSYRNAIRRVKDDSRPIMSLLLDNLASLYMSFGQRYSQAEQLRRRALQLRIAEVGPEAPGVATLLSNLGATCMELGRWREAGDLFQRALKLLEKTDTHETAGVLQNLAVLAGNQRNYGESASYLIRSIATLESKLGEDHPELVIPLLNAGRVQILMKRPFAAEPFLLRALRIAEQKLGREHPTVVEILASYETVLRRTKRGAEAKQAQLRAAQILAAHPELKAAKGLVHISDLRNLQK